jgi:hypothetical protein
VTAAEIDRRIAELERLLAEIDRDEGAPRPAPHEMTDQECVDAIRRLCKLPVERPRAMDPEEEAEVIAEWRRLTA